MKFSSNIKKVLLYYYLAPMRISIAFFIELHIEVCGGKYLKIKEILQKKGDMAFITTIPYIKKGKCRIHRL